MVIYFVCHLNSWGEKNVRLCFKICSDTCFPQLRCQNPISQSSFPVLNVSQNNLLHFLKVY